MLKFVTSKPPRTEERSGPRFFKPVPASVWQLRKAQFVTAAAKKSTSTRFLKLFSSGGVDVKHKPPRTVRGKGCLVLAEMWRPPAACISVGVELTTPMALPLSDYVFFCILSLSMRAFYCLTAWHFGTDIFQRIEQGWWMLSFPSAWIRFSICTPDTLQLHCMWTVKSSFYISF
jgi:hypothetical protein